MTTATTATESMSIGTVAPGRRLALLHAPAGHASF
jgi:hypothetical protein